MASDEEPYFFGYDTVVFTAASAVRVCAAMIEAQMACWPNLVLNLEWGQVKASQFGQNVSPADCLAKLEVESRVVVSFRRDAVMQSFFMEEAWLLDATGEGPFEVYFGPRAGIDFELERVKELAGLGELLPGVPRNPPDPYPAWLVAPMILEITLVTPGNPADEPFSRGVFERLRRCCR